MCVTRSAWTLDRAVARNPHRLPGTPAESAYVLRGAACNEVARCSAVFYDARGQAWIAWSPDLEDLEAADWSLSPGSVDVPVQDAGLP